MLSFFCHDADNEATVPGAANPTANAELLLFFPCPSRDLVYTTRATSVSVHYSGIPSFPAVVVWLILARAGPQGEGSMPRTYPQLICQFHPEMVAARRRDMASSFVPSKYSADRTESCCLAAAGNPVLAQGRQATAEQTSFLEHYNKSLSGVNHQANTVCARTATGSRPGQCSPSRIFCLSQTRAQRLFSHWSAGTRTRNAAGNDRVHV